MCGSDGEGTGMAVCGGGGREGYLLVSFQFNFSCPQLFLFDIFQFSVRGRCMYVQGGFYY